MAGFIARLVNGSWAPGAQPYEPVNGPRQVDPGWHALTGATVVTRPGTAIENATLVIRNGVVVSVNADGDPPAGARVWDVSGLTIYPGLIEAYAPVSVPDPDEAAAGSHWNAAVAAQRSALTGESLTADDRDKLRKLGFTVAHIAPDNGLLRGQTAVVALGEDRNLSDTTARVIDPSLWHAASLRRGSLGSSYPGSKMGAIALIRQTLADAQWWPQATTMHEENPARFTRPAPNDAVRSLADERAMFFIVDDELDLLRTARLAAEFEREAIFVGSGTELRRLEAIATLVRPVIVPVSFPARPRVETISDQEAISLQELMMWEQAPTNLRRLHGAGVPVAVTSSGLRRGEDFWKNLKSAIDHGLSEDDALAMLTTAPAEMLGIAGRYGTLEPGKQASFVVVDGELLSGSPTIRDVWTDGQRHEISAAPDRTLSGEYETTLTKNDSAISIRVEATSKNTKVTFVHAPDEGEAEADEEQESLEVEARKVERTGDRLNLLADASLFGEGETGTATVRLSFDGERVLGVARLTGGRDVRFSAQRQAAAEGDDEEKQEEEEAETPDVPERLAMPFGAFAYDEMPPQDPVVIHNATIWTNTDEGIIENGYVIFRDGKIERVGSGEPGGLPRIYRWIDAEGRHVTPGMLDCHSHTGIDGGVNEGTQAVTAEVAIADVINPDDINWYRQLAGGVTAVNQLHGSANPIGGQNSVVKLRWGAAHPDDMRMDGAPGGIKFALGENVKQSNWGGNGRYPQTRMGVETIMIDSFIAAREYAERRDNARRAGEPFRIDYELEILAEILAGDRLVHCHSYRQDEILMLCRVAEQFGFTIGSFQHVLEGYKVAEAIKEHAIGASSFSDWWGFKVEVFDGVPYNGAIMHDVGVNVSFNSDSNEVARRLNTEAAKAVRYGNVDPEEALKFVTLNVAKQLRIEERVGSIAPGMDADIAVWTASPLSSFARCERTFVDGREMFSLERDAQLRSHAITERDRIIQKIIADKKAKPEKPDADEPETEAARALDLLASGNAGSFSRLLRSRSSICSAGATASTRSLPAPETVGAMKRACCPRPADHHPRHPLSRITPAPERPAIMKKFLTTCSFLAASLAFSAGAIAQDLGVKAPPQSNPIILVGTVHTVANGVIERGVVMFDGGVITRVGDAEILDWIRPGPEVEVIELPDHMHIYPGLIGANTIMGLTEVSSVRATLDHTEVGDFTPEVRAASSVNPDSTLLPVTRSAGILTVGVMPLGGNITGRASVMRMDGWTWEDMAIEADAGLVVNWPSVRPSSAWWVTTPREEQIANAKRRLTEIDDFFTAAQSYLDAKAADESIQTDIRYEAMAPALRGESPVFIRANELQQIESAVEWATGRGLKAVIVGGQDAEQCADLLKRADVGVIIDGVHRLPGRRDHFYDEPFTLPARLEAAGVRWCLASGEETAHERNLPHNAGTAVAHGLDPEAGIRAITLSAAELLGVDDRIGSIEVGKAATLIVTDGNPMEVTTQTWMAFIDGRRISLADKQKLLTEKYLEKYRQLGLIGEEADEAADPE